jgi:beclin
LGQAALAISSISIKANYEFKKYLIMPMGSFARVALVADRRQTYNLHTDGSFSLFASTKKNFNAALIGLLCCIEELGEHVKSLDPTLTLPHLISASEGKINDIPISYGTDEEQWTKALKYMLTCIKWIIAWSTKHIYHRSLLRG